MVTICKEFDKDIFNPLLNLLREINIPRKTTTNTRRNFNIGHRSMTLGITRGRFNGKTDVSYYSKKYPNIYNEAFALGKLICPFEFNSVHVNNNVICPKHVDSRNVGVSLLVSFGEYTGANIVIDNIILDTKHTPVIFNGSELEHWNTDDLIGNKYSLVYYNTKIKVNS